MGTGRPGQPKLADAVWIALLERYVGGETAAALAREHGVSESAVRVQARNRGWRKMDRPGAVYRWVQPPPVTPAPAVPEARGFAFDPDDLDGSAADTAVCGEEIGFRERGSVQILKLSPAI